MFATTSSVLFGESAHSNLKHTDSIERNDNTQLKKATKKKKSSFRAVWKRVLMLCHENMSSYRLFQLLVEHVLSGLSVAHQTCWTEVCPTTDSRKESMHQVHFYQPGNYFTHASVITPPPLLLATLHWLCIPPARLRLIMHCNKRQ